MFKVNNKNTRTASWTAFLLTIFNIFYTFSSVSTADFDQ